MNVKPIVKWVGGKNTIIPDLLPTFPKETKTYHELFVGGGSVLIAFLQNNKAKHVHAYDVNETLISMYKNVQHDFESVYKMTKEMDDRFKEYPIDGEKNRNPLTIDEVHTREGFYYWTRNWYNRMSQTEKNGVQGTALFIFLNKICFRGLYRIGPNGFNVPYGNPKNVEVINYDNIKALNTLIKSVVFHCMDFRNALKKVQKGDFVYMDPPYVPIAHRSFVKYSNDGFTDEDHKCLFQSVKKLSSNGIDFVMSNSDGEMVLKEFTPDLFDIKTVKKSRAINSKNPGAKANELIISKKTPKQCK